MTETNKDMVRFVAADDGQVRLGGNDDPRKYLRLNGVYEVVKRDVHHWHTRVTLAGYPEQRFNAVHFDPLNDAEKWMELLSIGEIVKVKGEEFRVETINERTVVLRLMSDRDRLKAGHMNRHDRRAAAVRERRSASEVSR